jgi:bifunctional non-homologous end joining protein LigD
VIHKHRATRLHYDVRLERDGALPSWAVPKGLPTAKGDKRMAVRTEDHPLEYGKFEGTIPEGHYGAGEVRIFDNGWYEPIEWTDTKVSFRLHGRRYPDLEFHFVKTKRDWLAFLASAQTRQLIASPPRFSRCSPRVDTRPSTTSTGGSNRSSTASDAWRRCRRARPCCAREPAAMQPRSTRSCT